MKNKTRNIILIIGTLLFSFLLYRSAKQDYDNIKIRFKPNVIVLSTTPIFKKANLKSKITDSILAGTQIKVGKKKGYFYHILYIEKNNAANGKYIQQKAVKSLDK